jgi:Xaa-Pro aminopeptidase
MSATPVADNQELARARKALASSGCDFALLSSLANVTYASQWEVPVPLGALAEMSFGQPLMLVAVREQAAWLIVPNAYERAARDKASVSDSFAFDTFDSFIPTDSHRSYLGKILSAFSTAGLIGATGTIGIEGRTLPQSASTLVSCELVGWNVTDAEAPLAQARLIKTDREIELLRRASVVSDVAQNTLAELVATAGQTEFAMFGEITARTFEAAGRDIPLTGELVTGPRSTTVEYPNGPRERTTEPGDAALMDLSGRVEGYWFDCTNTHVIGGVEPTAEQTRYARAAQAACEAAMDALRPGAKASDAAAAAEAAFARFDLPMAHYAGHQVGVTVNELPRLVPFDHTPIEPGMVFSVEPGAYQGPGGTFGARSEKIVLVKESGPEILSTFAWGI